MSSKTSSSYGSRFSSSIGLKALIASTRDMKLLILLRMIRLFGCGAVNLILALYLASQGIGDSSIGLFMSLTLIGDLGISMVVTFVGDSMGVRFMIAMGAALMMSSGVVFAYFDNYWILLIASILGVINPSANEVDPFKAIEESAIARLSNPENTSDFFAWWSLLGMIGTATSTLITGFVIDWLQTGLGMQAAEAYNIIFFGYAGIGLLKLLVSFCLSKQVEIFVGTGEDAPLLFKSPSDMRQQRIIRISRTGSFEYSSASDSSTLSHEDTSCPPSLAVYYGSTSRSSGSLPLLKEASNGFGSPAIQDGPRETHSSRPDGNSPPSSSTDTIHSSSSAEDASPRLDSDSTSCLAKSETASRQPVFTPESFNFVWKLCLAMGFDFIGSGLAQISWMTYFFKREFAVNEGSLGLAIFIASLASSFLNLASSPMSRAIGQVPTMVICHTINSASLLMISVPNKTLALLLLIFRIVTRELDNAPRQAFIAHGVLPGERTSTMGVVNAVKIIASCIGLYVTGLFAASGNMWIGFMVAGGMKLTYNVLIAAFFWRAKPRE